VIRIGSRWAQACIAPREAVHKVTLHACGSTWALRVPSGLSSHSLKCVRYADNECLSLGAVLAAAAFTTTHLRTRRANAQCR